MDGNRFIPLEWTEVQEDVMLERARAVYEENKTRRTTRHFSSRDVDKSFIELAILSGGTAPNGAHLQPWTWVAISDTDLKRKIRRAAEEEERRTYEQRMPEAWAEVLAPLGTDAIKKHLTDAPWIVVLFRQKKRLRDNGEWGPTYYSTESCGIAAGLFINAVHRMGLTTLTHTPSPMKFLADLLGRPAHEEAMLVMPVGYPSAEATVPNIQRKSLEEIAYFIED